MVFDSVRFWDCASERLIATDGFRDITNPAMIPLRGDCVRFESMDGEFIVIDRHFEFRIGICSVLVNVQPAARDT